MAKRKQKHTVRKSNKKHAAESDSAYFLKMVIFLILGSMWVRIEHLPDWSIPLPIGLALGLVFAAHEHFQIDRKIEYVLLLLAAFISFWLPVGVLISV